MLLACPVVQTLVPSKPLDKRFPIISTICCSGCCRVLSGNTSGTKMLRLLATGSVDHWWCITRPSLGTTLSWGQLPHSRFHPPSLGQPASNVWSMQRYKVLLCLISGQFAQATSAPGLLRIYCNCSEVQLFLLSKHASPSHWYYSLKNCPISLLHNTICLKFCVLELKRHQGRFIKNTDFRTSF